MADGGHVLLLRNLSPKPVGHLHKSMTSMTCEVRDSVGKKIVDIYYAGYSRSTDIHCSLLLYKLLFEPRYPDQCLYRQISVYTNVMKSVLSCEIPAAWNKMDTYITFAHIMSDAQNSHSSCLWFQSHDIQAHKDTPSYSHYVETNCGCSS
jgi:hypothetical protein